MGDGLNDSQNRPDGACVAEPASGADVIPPSEALGAAVADSDASADDDEWEYDYEDELEEGDIWEYLDEDEQDANPLFYRNMQHTTDDLNSIYHEGVAVAREIKGAVDDIKGLFDLKGLFKL